LFEILDNKFIINKDYKTFFDICVGRVVCNKNPDGLDLITTYSYNFKTTNAPKTGLSYETIIDINGTNLFIHTDENNVVRNNNQYIIIETVDNSSSRIYWSLTTNSKFH